jgi:hypothetical protein
MVLILDGHAIHVTPRAVAYARCQGLSLIRFVPHSPHVAQPLHFYVSGMLKTIYSKGRQSKAMKRETWKMYRALLAFYKATIILMVAWSFERAGFLLDLENIRNPVQIAPSRVLDRIGVSDFEIDDSFIYPDHMGKKAEAKGAARKCTPTPKPSEFAMSVAAYIQIVIGTCPLCDHEEEEQVSNEEESDSNSTDPPHVTFVTLSLIQKFMDDHFPLNNEFCTQ